MLRILDDVRGSEVH